MKTATTKVAQSGAPLSSILMTPAGMHRPVRSKRYCLGTNPIDDSATNKLRVEEGNFLCHHCLLMQDIIRKEEVAVHFQVDTRGNSPKNDNDRNHWSDI